MEKEVTVPIKDVLKIIQYHASGEHDKVEQCAIGLAIKLEEAGETEISQYILAQYHLIPTWEIQ